MISDHRQVLYRLNAAGRVESRLFERGEEIPIPASWSDSPGKAKERTIVVATEMPPLPPVKRGRR